MDSNNSSSSSSSPTALLESEMNPPGPRNLPLSLIFLYFFVYLFVANIPTTASPVQNANANSSPNPLSKRENSYRLHCNDVVPESTLPSNTFRSCSSNVSSALPFTGFFSGGGRIFNKTAANFPKGLRFTPFRCVETVSNGVYKVQAALDLQNNAVYSVFGNPKHRLLRQIRFRGPRWLPRQHLASFLLSGYWSQTSGMLCMVGSSSSYVNPGNAKHFSAVLKVNYSDNSNIHSSLISGTLECSSDDKYNSNSFEPISLLGFSRYPNKEYTLIEKDKGSDWLSGFGGGDNLPLSTRYHDACPILLRRGVSYALEYGSNCGTNNCNPFGGSVVYLPDSMFSYGVWCKERKMQVLLGFPNSSYIGYDFPFDPNTTLIAETEWDEKENRAWGVACRILNVTNSWANAYVGDCSIRWSFAFPAVWSIRNRSSVVGAIWSRKEANALGYFSKIGFQTYWSRSIDLQGLGYEYTEIETVRKFCVKGKTVSAKGKTYPDGYSSDMGFDMTVKNSKGKVARGYSSPLFVGGQRYGQLYNVLPFPRLTEPAAFHLNNSHSGMLNISYKMSFTPPPDFQFGSDTFSKAVDISAEGIYDTDTGLLCMIGCRHLGSANQNLVKKDSSDCEIMIKVQFPPLRAENGEIVTGTIESTRTNSDPLYFEKLQLSANSITTIQAKASIWRMDLEITMVLISNTLACVFVGLQLIFVKKHPHVLPFISIAMVIVLMLGHMIPLLLNFEALFVGNHSQTSVFLGSGGWLEVYEVIVRVVTMVAFLLQLRLLQLTWSARQSDRSQEELWVSERKALCATLPMYIAGALIAWFVHRWRNSYRRPLVPFARPRRKGLQLTTLKPLSYQLNSFWEYLKSYAGLLLDGFLLPQILFNFFFNSGEKALSSSFYIGTTAVRLLPHAYDLYRGHSSTWYLDLSYIYANHKMDFYSTAWNIIIPCGGLLFAGLIYLQQRFGGRCILPRRFRDSSVYEKVPIISNEEL
ncbi:hypothetical protein CJ030_MR0G005169 [Morella rubra]|uniref:RING-type E3 ubiquitin transferase n=1 Tax=Morella rubra TaxID=262757 RepID=A0A6A1UKM9_9ROSI|nr:hypothetical protein CJ030_MR0G005169 [Morella rubra]